ncbi:putative small nucleolar ribonucleo protein complex subunit [Xylona heveae TC161]|uniref:Putative small nucleolar ribonucleo protein complex subunit n=1 Tax=Xylona heveae (strain CBS 132557 / TC161) TaxID=1328760 RepID=A0A165GP04_XYLHT|nr:putative small nucleolar ribonucleo protein complex subunit [Xylona heveae TC161]KZF22420.1 putative small nucleolar ribonucleo protein complex subunit [Xylona heveae TC161]
MAARGSKKARQEAVSRQKPEELGQDNVMDEAASFAGRSDDEMPEKDSTEAELEKLVFGDESGFLEGLKSHRAGEYSEEDESVSGAGDEESGAEEAGLTGISDADLFFMDSGPDAAPMDAMVPAAGKSIAEQGGDDQQEQAAWEDSDDEKMAISLASNPRLRKLRVAEAEDVVNGKEYIRRLRQQFERLYPVPEWANPSAATKKPARKKRRRNSGAAESSGEETSDEDMDVDEELSQQPLADLLRNADSLVRGTDSVNGKRGKLRPEVLDIQRTKDVGGTQPSAITSLEFHPKYPLLLSSGPASTIFLHQISPVPPNPNPLITSFHLRRTPLSSTSFSPTTGSRIFLSGRRRYFHVWDLSSGRIEKVSRIYGHQEEQKSMERFKLSPCGRYMGLVGSARKGGGYINILDAQTLQWIAQARIEGRGGIADFAWWADGEGLAAASKGGEVFEWSIQHRRVIARWRDEGAVGTTVLALGGANRSGASTVRPDGVGPDRWVAIGSSSGIVNIYDRRSWTSNAAAAVAGENDAKHPATVMTPKPIRAFEQLTTPVSNIVFSPDSQLLAISSRWKKDALRLVHLPSCTVYRNWPTSATPLGRITSVAFSPDGGMLAVANEAGKIRLWEIRA